MMKTVKLSDFNAYLNDQVGEPYVWGGQHTKLTPDNYVAVITKKESDPNNRENAIAFCEKKFSDGAEVLYAYDCSGLGMYYLQNVTGVYPHDMSANSMMGECSMIEKPVNGSWLFRLNDGRATHIGYMVSDTECIHAAGRKLGVIKVRFDKAYWHRYGKPKCVEVDEPEPPKPEPTHKYVVVKGIIKKNGKPQKSVHVRLGNGVMHPSVGIAHSTDRFRLLMQADSNPYWYMIDYNGVPAYITCNERYTETVYGV